MDDLDFSFDFEESLQGSAQPSQPAAQPAGPRPPSLPHGAGQQHQQQQDQTRALTVLDHSAASSSGRHFRQTVCTYWLKGLCMKGNECGFLHEFDPARMPLCRNLIKWGECRDVDCPFKHAVEDLKECNMYRLGFCVYGAQCRYKHTRVPGPPPDPTTVEYAKPRGTRYGDRWIDAQARRAGQPWQEQGPRPPSGPRPSAADLSSGRVAEPEQPPQQSRPESQPPEQPQQGEQQGAAEDGPVHGQAHSGEHFRDPWPGQGMTPQQQQQMMMMQGLPWQGVPPGMHPMMFRPFMRPMQMGQQMRPYGGFQGMRPY